MGYNIPEDHHGPTPAQVREYLRTSEGAIDTFIEDVEREVRRAMKKFPQPNPTIAALAEEVGELSKAMLHIREGKHNDWWRVYDEAVQVAAMACRAAIEGDPTFGVVPTADNTK